MNSSNSRFAGFYISSGLKRIIGDTEPLNWAYKASEQLLRLSNQHKPATNLTPILPLRRINPTIVFEEKLEPLATLRITNDGFQIIANESLKDSLNSNMLRFTIAHEIGHTFFYDIHKKPPVRFHCLRSFDRGEDKLCDLFASALLTPDEWIYEKFDIIRNSNIFYIIKKLSSFFRVSYSAMAYRLIHDLNLWNGVLLSCKWSYKDNTRSPNKMTGNVSEKQAWRIIWRIVPGNLLPELFIPSPTKKNKNLPSVKWKELDRIVSTMKPFDIKELVISSLEAGRLGNLRKIMHKYIGTRNNYKVWITVLDAYKAKAKDDMKDLFTENESKQNKTVLLAIPLEDGPSYKLLLQEKPSNERIKTDRQSHGELQLPLPFK